MRILTRYFLRSHVGPFLFALSALTLVMLLDQIGKRFDKLVGKGLEPTVIAEVFALSIPFILAMTLPMAVLLAVLYTFNRMAGDNEITALKANGVHLPSLMAPVLGVAVLLAGGMVWFNDTILPESNHRLQVLLSSISQKKPTLVLRERTVNEVLEGELYIQVARIDRRTNGLEDVVIYDHRQRKLPRTIYADGGQMAFSDDRTDLHLTLTDGVSQQQRAGEEDAFQRIHFQRAAIRVPDVTNELQREDLDSYRGDREMSISQMRERVRSARAAAEGARAESRETALLATRRLLGEEVEPPPEPGDGSGEAAAGDSAAAGPGPRQDGGNGGTDGGGPAAGAADAPPGADSAGATDDSAGGASARDSLLAKARRDAWQSVDRARSARSLGSRFGSLHTRETSSLSRAARYGVEIQKKWSIPAACVVFVLIGAPLAVRFREAGVAMVVAASLLFFCAYYVSLVGGEELADELILSPFWAMWTPNVLFGGVGVFLVWRSVKVG